VTVSARELDERVEIRVADSGTGVPDAVRPRLFDRFSSGTPRGGTGLGLYIVREIARAHGGEAHYELAEDGRPTFVIDLPRIQRAADPQLPGMP
jgi:hypothetical protein